MKVYILWHSGYEQIEGVFASEEAAQAHIDGLVAADPNDEPYIRGSYCISEHEVKA